MSTRFSLLKDSTGSELFANQDACINDQLLNNFTDSQKKYIVENLYVTINRSLQHFVAEAIKADQIQISASKLQQQPTTTSMQNTLQSTQPRKSGFGSYQANVVVQNNQVEQKQASAFGSGFKMSQKNEIDTKKELEKQPNKIDAPVDKEQSNTAIVEGNIHITENQEQDQNEQQKDTLIAEIQVEVKKQELKPATSQQKQKKPAVESSKKAMIRPTSSVISSSRRDINIKPITTPKKSQIRAASPVSISTKSKKNSSVKPKGQKIEPYSLTSSKKSFSGTPSYVQTPQSTRVKTSTAATGCASGASTVSRSTAKSKSLASNKMLESVLSQKQMSNVKKSSTKKGQTAASQPSSRPSTAKKSQKSNAKVAQNQQNNQQKQTTTTTELAKKVQQLRENDQKNDMTSPKLSPITTQKDKAQDIINIETDNQVAQVQEQPHDQGSQVQINTENRIQVEEAKDLKQVVASSGPNEQGRPMSYGSFGQKKNDNSDTANVNGLQNNQQQSSESKSFSNYNINKNSASLNPNFNAVKTFQKCLKEVIELKRPNNQIFRSSSISHANIPEAYLKTKRGSVFHKAFDSQQQISNFKPPVYEKTEESRAFLVNQFKDSFLTSTLSNEQHLVLANSMQSKDFKTDELIIKYGDMGSEYYLLSSGQVEVTVYNAGANPSDPRLQEQVQFKKTLGSGVGFGEIALMYNDKRTATVKAIEPCQVFVLSADVFKHIIISNSIKRRNLELGFLEQVDMFKPIDKLEKLKLISGMEIINLKQGEFVFREGDKGSKFYILEKGTVECLKDQSGELAHVRDLQEGNHFGEIAILNNITRTLSVRVISTEAKLLILSRSSFNRILGSINQYLKKDYDGEFERRSETSSQNSSMDAKQINKSVTSNTNLQLIAEVVEDDENNRKKSSKLVTTAVENQI